ncbi:hypothetical protein F5Y10DRAFT_293258 [Nemania abortiva]|nr:hypothetical protein F5Y10DRAFT_293258 [Nemania abortiva]
MSESNMSASNMSESNMSESNMFESNTSETDASKTDAPGNDAFESNASETDASKTDASKTDDPRSDTFESSASETDVSETDVSETDASESNMSESNMFESEYDLATTHKRNADLQQNSAVISYLDMLKNIESLKDTDTCDQLSMLTFDYLHKMIPLFESKQEPGDNDEDYQLCIYDSYLIQDELVETPHFSLLRLSGPKDIEQPIPKYIICLGRLFVNAKKGNSFDTCCYSKRKRLTRWTGHELFIGDDLGIWSVFDPSSDCEDTLSWYPVSSRLERNLRPGIACLLPSVKKLGGITFEEIAAHMENTRVQGAFQIHEVEMKEANEWLNGKPEETSRHELIQQGTQFVETIRISSNANNSMLSLKGEPNAD